MYKIETKEGINWTPLIVQLQYNILKFDELEPAEQAELKQIFQIVIDWASKFYNNLCKFAETYYKNLNGELK